MKLDELVESRDPISGEKGGLFEIETWTESIGGWIVWLGSAALAVWVVTAVMGLFGGSAGNIVSRAGTFVNGLLGRAAPASAASAAPAASGFFQ